METLNMREDFESVVLSFYDSIRNYDLSGSKNINDYLEKEFRVCMSFKGEMVDYSFVPEGLDLKLVKSKEDMLIASTALRLVMESVDCDESEIVDVYGTLRDIGKEKGWDLVEFDRNCLLGLGVEVRKMFPPPDEPTINFGKDYN